MIKARAVRTWVAAAGFALAAAITTATPAAAAPAVAAAPDSTAAPASVQTSYYLTAVPSNGRVSCYGYYGTFKAGTRVMVVNWIYTSDECFGIATDGTVWHTWPNSGGWKKMAGTMYASDVSGPYPEQSTGKKGVEVWVESSHTVWVQIYAPPLGWTGEWTRV